MSVNNPKRALRGNEPPGVKSGEGIWIKTGANVETMNSTSIKVGDKFIKPDVPNIVWVVERLVDLPALPPHAELRVQGHFSRTMMMSQDALIDHRLFHRIEDS